MAIIQRHTSHPKTWFERFFFVRIDGESVEESYLHLFRREWNFTHGNTNSYVFRFDTLKTCENDFFIIFSAAGRSSGIPSPLNGFEARWSSIDLEPSLSLWTFRMA